MDAADKFIIPEESHALLQSHPAVSTYPSTALSVLPGRLCKIHTLGAAKKQFMEHA